MLRKAFLVLAICLPMLSFGQRKFGQQSSQTAINRDVIFLNASNINTDGLEFSPVLYENGLVYVSRNKNGLIDENTGKTFFELFYSELDPNGTPTKAQKFSNELNSQLHEGPVTFNRKGNKIYFTRSNLTKGLSRADKKGRVGLKIYEAERGDFDWENIVELPFNDDEYSCMHPALSADETKLFFSSNMPGGYGGMDLYFVEKRYGEWTAPINLGADINTSRNEVFPFMHDNGTLFFASDGHEGLGGLDIYMINIQGRRWGQLLNLGEPFNSIKDDLGLILDIRGTKGYLTSNRDGGMGSDDIYIFEAPNGLQGVKGPENIATTIATFDGQMSRRLPETALFVFEISPNGLVENNELYDLQMVTADPTLNDSTDNKEITLKLIRKDEKNLGEPNFLTDRNGEALMAFDIDKEYLILASKSGYDTKEIKFSPGDVSTGMPLEIVLERSNCLALRGVITTVDNPIPVPGTLIRIINSCDASEQVVRTNMRGEFTSCLPFGCEFVIKAQRQGFEDSQTKVSTQSLRGTRSIDIGMELKPESELVLKEPIRTGSVIILENIYYDFNKSAIRKGAAPDLEALARLMKKYPSLEIELGAHTDSRGEKEYNLELSLKRADAAKQFLTNRGIASDRIKSFGYGEARIRNNCKDGVPCSEEEHQYNRRTEVKVLKIDEQPAMNSSNKGSGTKKN
jgi:outer membrane protein OmpA-like peptidoglycan-associated protein